LPTPLIMQTLSKFSHWCKPMDTGKHVECWVTVKVFITTVTFQIQNPIHREVWTCTGLENWQHSMCIMYKNLNNFVCFLWSNNVNLTEQNPLFFVVGT
jgi:hypothetical protein